MMEKRYSECRDIWIVAYNDTVQFFETEKQADNYINESLIKSCDT